jgi:hypothetical protein
VVTEGGMAAKYLEMEAEMIMASCGLTDAEWNTGLPALYERMLEEGRKVPKV